MEFSAFCVLQFIIIIIIYYDYLLFITVLKMYSLAGLCHSGTDQRDYLYFIAEGNFKMNVCA